MWDNTELYFTDTTDLFVIRCEECGSIDFEFTITRKFCARCGLVVWKYPYSSDSTVLEEVK